MCCSYYVCICSVSESKEFKLCFYASYNVIIVNVYDIESHVYVAMLLIYLILYAT